MDIALRTAADVAIVEVTGRLDSQTSPELEAGLKSLIDAGQQKVVANFERLEYMSSAGLRVLLWTAKKLRATDGEIRVCSLNEVVREVFEISGFSTILNTFATETDALERF